MEAHCDQSFIVFLESESWSAWTSHLKLQEVQNLLDTPLLSSNGGPEGQDMITKRDKIQHNSKNM